MLYWIIGAGKFGARAAKKLVQAQPDARILLVDSDLDTLLALPSIGGKQNMVETCFFDAIDFMEKNLLEDAGVALPGWIVPAAPIHIAGLWLARRLAKHFSVNQAPLPKQFIAQLPNAMTGPDGTVYASWADFMCPEDCPEPENTCFATKKPRQANLFDLMEQAAQATGALPLVIRSHQLAQGVGGYRPQELFDALEKAAASPTGRLIISATACRCHGVAQGFIATPSNKG
ncbi:MAG: hypothetical protein QMD09_08750 [Desulfatibacillaceae bacterium]|nr:hypothetical protein [Desulfatibacillaceae bacterium]